MLSDLSVDQWSNSMKPRLFIAFLFVVLTGALFAQRPSQPDRPGPAGKPPRVGGAPPAAPHPPPPGEWIKPHDINQNGILEADEFNAALARTFAEFDRNGNGAIDPGEGFIHNKPVGPPP